MKAGMKATRMTREVTDRVTTTFGELAAAIERYVSTRGKTSIEARVGGKRYRSTQMYLRNGNVLEIGLR